MADVVASSGWTLEKVERVQRLFRDLHGMNDIRALTIAGKIIQKSIWAHFGDFTIPDDVYADMAGSLLAAIDARRSEIRIALEAEGAEIGWQMMMGSVTALSTAAPEPTVPTTGEPAPTE